MNKRKIEKGEFNCDFDSDQELKELEQKLGSILDDYDVEYPSEEEIMMTIDAIRPHVPVKVNRWHAFYGSIYPILKQALHEILYISPLFWILNSIFLVFGLVAVFLIEQNPYMIIMLLAPIPTINGLIEVLKSRSTGMAELEMSFKYSLQEIILSRMLVVGGFNLVFNLILTFSISFLHQDVVLLKFVLYWITPFTVVTAASLVFVSKFKNSFIAILGFIGWIVFGVILSQEPILNRINALPQIFYVLLTFLAAVSILIKAKQIYTRGVTYEFNH